MLSLLAGAESLSVSPTLMLAIRFRSLGTGRLAYNTGPTDYEAGLSGKWIGIGY